MPVATLVSDPRRYRLIKTLDEGGMGVVYLAHDQATDRQVALKSIRNLTDRQTIDYFKREYGRQKALNHPNIIDIYDIGEMEIEGQIRPYFTMPYLTVSTLAGVMRDDPGRLTITTIVEIASQVCKGLHAAHQAGVIHRDVKPKNIFVLPDNSVKLIDFGIAHSIGTVSVVVPEGTPHYMSPEQVRSGTPTPASDVFSLAVTCYELLTGKKPFDGPTSDVIQDAICNHIPTPVHRLRSDECQALSQVIHTGMAKDPRLRFESAREFSEALQKAVRGDPIERFAPESLAQDLQRVRKCIDDDEYEIASGILVRLEAQWLSDEIDDLRRAVTAELTRRRVEQCFATAVRLFKNEEYALALGKIADVLILMPDHAPALELKSKCEAAELARRFAALEKSVKGRLDERAYGEARRLVRLFVEDFPEHGSALALMRDIARQEARDRRIRERLDDLYRQARQEIDNGNVTGAYSRAESLLALGPTQVDQRRLCELIKAAYQDFQAGYDEIGRLLEQEQYRGAVRLCDELLRRYPSTRSLQAMSFEAREREQQKISALIAEVDRSLLEEPNLDRKIEILKTAAEKLDHPHFQERLNSLSAKRNLRDDSIGKAREKETAGHFTNALEEWRAAYVVDPMYPGIQDEVGRLQRLVLQEEQNRTKAFLIEGIRDLLNADEFDEALRQIDIALSEFRADPALMALRAQLLERQKSMVEAFSRLDSARRYLTEGRRDHAWTSFLWAEQTAPDSSAVRNRIHQILDAEAKRLRSLDNCEADRFINEARKNYRDWSPPNLIPEPAPEQNAPPASPEPVKNTDPPIEPPDPPAPVDHTKRDFVEKPVGNRHETPKGDAKEGRSAATRVRAWWVAIGYRANRVWLALLEVLARILRACIHQAGLLPSLFARGNSLVSSAGFSRIRLLILQACSTTGRAIRRPQYWIAALAAASMMSVLAAPFVFRWIFPIDSKRDVDRPPIPKPPQPPLFVQTSFVKIAAALRPTEVQDNGHPMSRAEDGSFDLSPGQHDLQFKFDAVRRANVRLKVAEDQPPRLEGPPSLQRTKALFVMSHKGQSRLICTWAPATISIEGQFEGQIGAEGLSLPLSNGVYSVRFRDPQTPVAYSIEIDTHRPSLFAVFSPDRVSADVEILTNQRDFRLYVDDKEYRLPDAEKSVVRGLGTGRHTVRLEKSGFVAEPQESVVEITDSGTRQVTVTFSRIVTSATLEVKNSTPDSDVVVADVKAKTDSAGNVRIEVPSGKHAVIVRRKECEAFQTDIEFTAGNTAELKDIRLRCRTQQGTVQIQVYPLAAEVYYGKVPNPPNTPFVGSTMQLDPGEYVFQARVTSYKADEKTVTVDPGATVIVKLTPTRPPPAERVLGIKSWNNVSWQLKGGWYVSSAKDVLPYPQPFHGSMSVETFKGKGRKLRWVLNYEDDRNYELFTLSDDKLEWVRLENGKKVEPQTMRHSIPLTDDVCVLQIRSSSGSFTQSIANGRTGVPKDLPAPKISRSDRNGRFGFRLDGDEIWINNFTFRPQ